MKIKFSNRLAFYLRKCTVSYQCTAQSRNFFIKCEGNKLEYPQKESHVIANKLVLVHIYQNTLFSQNNLA